MKRNKEEASFKLKEKELDIKVALAREERDAKGNLFFNEQVAGMIAAGRTLEEIETLSQMFR